MRDLLENTIANDDVGVWTFSTGGCRVAISADLKMILEKLSEGSMIGDIQILRASLSLLRLECR